MIIRKRLPKCAMCRNRVLKYGAKACSPNCAQLYIARQKERAHMAREKSARMVLKNGRRALMSRTDHQDEAKTAIQMYVRLRDHLDGCISCDKPANWGGQWHGSHLRQAGNVSATRFNLWNINKACSECNRHKGGNPVEYEIKLIAKIGADKVAWLKLQNHVVKYSIEYMQRIKKIFNKKSRILKRRIELNTGQC